MSETSPSEGRPPRPPRQQAKRYGAYAVGVLASFGILGALGTRAVDALFAGSERIRGSGPPIQFNVREDPQGGGDGFSIAARSPEGFDEALRGVEDCTTLFTAAKGAGAVDIGTSITDLLLEGNQEEDVAIVGMRAKILLREQPLGGALISCESAGSIDAIAVAFDLDERAPVARTLPNFYGEPGPPYFAGGNVIVLRQGEIQPIHVVAKITRGYVEWKIEADLVVDGKATTITIDDAGKPFRLTGRRDEDDYDRYYEWVWYENPGHLYASDTPKDS